jgi:LysM repeat protein
MIGTAHAADETYPIKVPAQSEETAPALEASPVEITSPAPYADESKPAPAIRKSAPLRYEVKKGDTLWAIAGYFLQNPWQWPEIWYSNDQIKNPHRIYPGNVLRLVMINGRPRLVMGEDKGKDKGPRKLSPKIRGQALATAIPAIPIEAIRDFLRSPKLITKDELDNTPYLIDFTDNHMIGGADTGIFVKNLPARAGEYSVVRKGEAYIDPETDEELGYEAIPVGLAEAEQRRNSVKDVGVARLTTVTIEARIGDHLLPLNEEFFDAYFYPRAPEKDIKGSIISVFDGASQIGRYQVVALNRGAKDGLAPGHVLTVMQTGRTARDPQSTFGSSVQLPATEAGTVMVFKVTPRLSYALVVDATREIHAGDGVVKPQ